MKVWVELLLHIVYNFYIREVYKKEWQIIRDHSKNFIIFLTAKKLLILRSFRYAEKYLKAFKMIIK